MIARITPSAVLGGVLALVAAGRAMDASATVPSPMSTVMPAPASLQFTTGRLRVTPAFTVALAGEDDPRLRAAIERALRRWEERTTLRWRVTPNGGYAFASTAATATLVVACERPAAEYPALGDDESYALSITASQATLRAPTVLGALRGLETLLQLLDADQDGWYVPAVEIKDAPRFGWRGLLMDPCRHWMPVEVIKRTLDCMAVVKLNVLHWHLSDDQGFRIESKRFPLLQERASDGLYYTQEQAREIVRYAADRGIRVVPEFDVPAHATSWAVAYPELASAPGPYALSRGNGIFNAVLDPTNEQVYALLDAFFGEMSTVFPDAYLHIGGDENNGKHWNANPRIQAFIAEHHLGDNAGLQTYFNQRVGGLLEKHGRQMVGWDEILQPGLPSASVVQSWRGAGGVAAAARAGHPVLLSHGFYLDHPDRVAAYYANDPLPADTPLAPEQQRLVIGGEACMWSEWVSPETVDAQIWPRAAAIAERLWSPRAVNDVGDMYRRLHDVSGRLEEAGALHEKNPAAMLRRLAGSAMPASRFAAVQAVAAWTEAGTAWRRKGPNSLCLPLTQLVNCAPVESANARQFAAAIDTFVLRDRGHNAGSAALLRALFADWGKVGHDAVVRIDQAPGLRDLPRAANALRNAGRIGDVALTVLAGGAPPDPEWPKAALPELERLADEHDGGLVLPFVEPVRRLVVAATLVREGQRMSDAEWRRAVSDAEAKARAEERPKE